MPDMLIAKLFTVALCVCTATTESSEFEFHHDNVMGTQMELTVVCPDAATARIAETAALNEIDLLTAVLSTWSDSSEVTQWMNSDEAVTISPDLTRLLKLSDQWMARTNGAFHPGVERLTQIWKQAEFSGVLPSDDEISVAVNQLGQHPWLWSSDSLKAKSSYRSTFNAIAKGYIIDRVSDRVMGIENINGLCLNIGGDVRVSGERRQRVSVRTEAAQSGKDWLLDTVVLYGQSIATSGPQFRGFTVAGKQFSHLIDPRSGMPVSHVRSSSVVADTAADADALATACSVLTIDESLALIDSIPHAACLLMDDKGQLHASSGWEALRMPNRLDLNYRLTNSELDEKSSTTDKAGSSKTRTMSTWNGGMELQVDLEINQADSGGRYRRPYVACWIEDKDGFPVRTLLLWVQADGRGPRWIPDLRRWHKSDRLRKLAEDTELVGTISEATRKPGKYSVLWDGTDDNGAEVKAGTYTFYLEAAREHGTYQLLKDEITVADKSFERTLKGNVEIKAASLTYRKQKTSDKATEKSR